MNTQRYNRQIILPEIGTTGQQKLLDASVLIAGVGGLGSIISLYLSAAGIGTIGLVDGDNVSITNLQRQILYNTTNIGKPKVKCAKEHLQKLNEEIQINTYDCYLDETNIVQIASKYDIIIDGLDNSTTRYLLDNISKKQNKPYIYGGIREYIGQVSVFNYHCGNSYADLFPQQIPDKKIYGLFGVLAGIIGTLEANEAIKIITNTGTILSNKLLEYNIRTNTQTIFEIKK